MTMASRIVVMKLGHIQQIGSPIEIYNHPANIFVAGFIGSPSMNLMKATYEKGIITLSDGKKITCTPDVAKVHDEFYKAEVEALKAKIAEMDKDPNVKAEDKAKAPSSISRKLPKPLLRAPIRSCYGIRPEDIHEGKGAGSYDLKVAVAELLGHEYYVHSDFAGIDLVAKIPLTHEIKIGDTRPGHLRRSRRRTSSIRRARSGFTRLLRFSGAPGRLFLYPKAGRWSVRFIAGVKS
jgi:ABC-type sugar transport system ATPase subunit